MAFKSLLIRLVALTLAATAIHGCASPSGSSPDEKAEFERNNDPFEIPNRFVFAFNRAVDTLVLRPVAVFYRDIVPTPVQDGTHNVLTNLGEPVTAFNELFQGKPGRAGTTLARFVINSTIGVLGIFDVAKGMGLSPTDEDFGQTLGVWTNSEDGGPYLVLPLLGPSNPRDAIGLVVDYFVDPFNIAINHYNVQYLGYIRAGVTAVDYRSRTIQVLDDLERNSLDYYAAIRSAYRQRRAAEIRDENYGSSSKKGPGTSMLFAPAPDREGDIAFAR
jgi:phospholipid-binding lipoprotein MlaA